MRTSTSTKLGRRKSHRCREMLLSSGCLSIQNILLNYVDQQENGHARQSIEIIHVVREFPSEEGQQEAGAFQQSDVA